MTVKWLLDVLVFVDFIGYTKQDPDVSSSRFAAFLFSCISCARIDMPLYTPSQFLYAVYSLFHHLSLESWSFSLRPSRTAVMEVQCSLSFDLS